MRQSFITSALESPSEAAVGSVVVTNLDSANPCCVMWRSTLYVRLPEPDPCSGLPHQKLQSSCSDSGTASEDDDRWWGELQLEDVSRGPASCRVGSQEKLSAADLWTKNQ